MGDSEARAARNLDPTPNANKGTAQLQRIAPQCGKLMIGTRRNDGNESLCCVTGECERYCASQTGSRHDPAFHEFVTAGRSCKIRRPIRLPHGIIGIGPDAKPQGTSTSLDCKQFGNAGPIVGKGVDARQPEREHMRLRPNGRLSVDAELTELASVAISSLGALQQTNRTAANDRLKGPPRLSAQRPIVNIGTAKTEPRRLNTRKAEMQAIVEQHGIAVGYGGCDAADAFDKAGDGNARTRCDGSFGGDGLTGQGQMLSVNIRSATPRQVWQY